jgi:hypothetical protein
VRAVLISGEFDGRLWKAKYSDNESRGSVAVSFTILVIQSSAQTNPLSKNLNLSKTIKAGFIRSKRPQTFFSIKNQNKMRFVNLENLKLSLWVIENQKLCKKHVGWIFFPRLNKHVRWLLCGTLLFCYSEG